MGEWRIQSWLAFTTCSSRYEEAYVADSNECVPATTLLTGATSGPSSLGWGAIKKVEMMPPTGNQLQLNSWLLF